MAAIIIAFLVLSIVVFVVAFSKYESKRIAKHNAMKEAKSNKFKK